MLNIVLKVIHCEKILVYQQRGNNNASPYKYYYILNYTI